MEQGVRRGSDIEEQAAIWCARLFGPSAAPFDEPAFQDWIGRDEAHRPAFDSMVQTWLSLEGIELSDLSSRPPPAVEDEDPAAGDLQRGTGMFNRRRALAMVGGASAAAVGGLYFSQLPRRFSTSIGDRSLVRLDDGTRIELDGASLVRFRESKSARQAWLDEGRASFDVARDVLRPFSVTVHDKIVVAVGTSFSVERLHGQVRAGLYSGKVEIIDRAAPGRSHTLVPGDRFVSFDDGRPATITRGHADDDLGWTSGVLSFDNESLAVAVEQMNRYSSQRIVLQPGLAAGKMSGIFKAGDTSEFVTAVSELLGLHAEQDGSTIRLMPRSSG